MSGSVTGSSDGSVGKDPKPKLLSKLTPYSIAICQSTTESSLSLLGQSPPGERPSPSRSNTLCAFFKDKHTVANDNMVTFDGVIFQIPKKSAPRSYANKRIDVHVALDGSVEFFYKQGKSLALTPKKRVLLAYIEQTRSGKAFASTHFQFIKPKSATRTLTFYVAVT